MCGYRRGYFLYSAEKNILEKQTLRDIICCYKMKEQSLYMLVCLSLSLSLFFSLLLHQQNILRAGMTIRTTTKRKSLFSFLSLSLSLAVCVCV